MPSVREPRAPFRSETVSRLAWLSTVFVGLVGVGFCFHTSYEGTILGKYSPRYTLLLGIWFFAVVPLAHLLTRFLVDTQTITLTSGRAIHVRPRLKITLFVAMVLGSYLGLDFYMRSLVARRTASIRADVFHPYLQNAPNPEQRKLAINDAGFRGDPIRRKRRPNTYRIFVFGGSTALSGSLRPYETHFGILERELAATYPHLDIEIQNAAADWHCSQHSVMKLLFRVQDYEPDLVIIFHGINDLIRGFVPDEFARGEYKPDYGHYLGPVANLVNPARAQRLALRLYLGCWMSDFRFHTVPVRGPNGNGINGIRVMYFPKTEPVEVTEWVSLEPFERNMRDFVHIARAKGMRVLLGTQPSLYRDDLDPAEERLIWIPISQHWDGNHISTPSMVDGMEAFNACTKRIAADLDVDLIDLERLVPKTLDHFYDDVHYTRLGHEVIAAAFHEHLVEGRVLVDAVGAAAPETP